MSQHRHILLASHTPTATSGYGRVMRRLAQAFRDAGHNVTALGSGYNSEAHELPYPILPWPNDRPAESLAAALRDTRPDGAIGPGLALGENAADRVWAVRGPGSQPA